MKSPSTDRAVCALQVLEHVPAALGLLEGRFGTPYADALREVRGRSIENVLLNRLAMPPIHLLLAVGARRLLPEHTLLAILDDQS